MVTFKSNGTQVPGYLSLPASGRGPAVIVIQEWWGLVDHIKDVADRFARDGYVALAPDLYHGKSTTEPNEAQKLMMSLRMDQPARDLSGAYDYLIGLQEVSPKKVGAVGFCMGGGLSLYLATLKPIDACVIYYGVIPGNVTPDLSSIKGAVLGHFADQDEWASPAAAHQLESQLKGRGTEASVHIYPNTQHAFFNDSRKEVYSREAAELSWRRTLEFYQKHLC
jgi:carboxymethylenebutenolidase